MRPHRGWVFSCKIYPTCISILRLLFCFISTCMLKLTVVKIKADTFTNTLLLSLFLSPGVVATYH